MNLLENKGDYKSQQLNLKNLSKVAIEAGNQSHNKTQKEN